ncbi:MAG TPA: acetoacetyl-CoA reductase [Gemmatimonadales bacterium]|jgi:acetoacetyl-CoA reductase
MSRRPAGPRARLALVTGGTGGIGTEICRQLATAGHRVATTYVAAEAPLARRWQRDRRAEGQEPELVECDVASFESCTTMAEDIKARLGTVEILVNCAGITRDKTLAKMEPAQWSAVLDTNLNGAFNVTRQLIDGMIERRFGRIVCISSVNGQRGQFGQTNYSAAKAGLFGFTRALALEVAADGITVNTVSPGYVDTSMVAAIPKDIREAIIRRIPVGRLAHPGEIARAVSFLVADESGYITGANLAVNGGLYLGS